MNVERRIEEIRRMPFAEVVVQPDIVLVDTIPVGGHGVKRAVFLVPKEASTFLYGQALLPDDQGGHWAEAAFVGLY